MSIDEIMIERLVDAHDREMENIFYPEDENDTNNWDEWFLDNAIDRAREDMYE